MKILDIISEEKKKNCGCGKDPCETYGKQQESKDEYKPHMMYKGSKKDYRAKYPTKKKHHDSLMNRGYNHDDPETKKVEEYGSSQPLTSIKPKAKKVKERYGMRPSQTLSRDQQDDYMNMNKRFQNRNQDQNREMQIRQQSLFRRQNRLAKKVATGIPGRILNPPQGQG